MTLDRRAIAISALVLVAILFLAVNLAADTFFRSARLDLTEGRIYTLSEGTRKVLGSLEEPITVRFYFSEEVAAGFADVSAYASRVRDLLQEYKAQSNGRLIVEAIDPKPFSEDEDHAVAQGIEGRATDQNSTIYFGLVASNTIDGAEVVPFFDQRREEYLEYDLSSMIYRLNARIKPKLGVVTNLPLDTGPGGLMAAMQGRSQPFVIYQQLQENFDIEFLEQDFDRVPDTISALMIAHPKALTPTTLYAIDQFVMRGGRVIAFVDPMSEISQLQGEGGAPVQGATFSSDLAPLLKSWGVAYDPNVIVGDRARAAQVQFGGSRETGQRIDYVLWMSLQQTEFNADDLATSELKTLNIGTPGVLNKAENATTTFTPLITTTDQSMEIPADDVRSGPQPDRLLRMFLPSGQKFTIAARVSGPAVSAYPDGPPAAEAKPEGEDAPPAGPKLPLPAHIKEAASPINVIVMADSDLFDDRFWVQVQEVMGQRVPVSIFGDNAAFVLNAVQNMLGSNDLISLRTRQRVERKFTRTQELRRIAETRFMAERERLEADLQETQRKITELQRTGDPSNQGGPLLTPEQEAEIQRFLEKSAETKAALRDVQRKLRIDVDRLGNFFAFVNMALVPILVILFAIAFAMARSRRRRMRASQVGS